MIPLTAQPQCRLCLDEAASSRSYGPAIHVDRARPSSSSTNSDSSTSTCGVGVGVGVGAALHVTPYRKAITRKRTYSLNSPRTNIRILSPPGLVNGAGGGGGIIQPRPSYSPRRLEFDSHPASDGAAASSAATDGVAGRRLKSSPPPRLGLLALTGGGGGNGIDPLPLASEEVLLLGDDDTGGVAVDGIVVGVGDDEEVKEQVEEDSETELETEIEKDVIRWWTPAGWWAQICLLLGLGVKLISILGMSLQWMKMLWRLILFSIALTPAWWLIGRTYLTAKYIKRGIRYGLNARNYVDLYLPHRILAPPCLRSSNVPPSSNVPSSSSSSSCDLHLCPAHRASQAAQVMATRKASVEKLSLVERLHLHGLLQAFSDGREVETNAFRELHHHQHHHDGGGDDEITSPIPIVMNDVGSNTTIVSNPSKAEQFAAALISNAADAQPTMTTATANGGESVTIGTTTHRLQPPPHPIQMSLQHEHGSSTVYPSSSSSFSNSTSPPQPVLGVAHLSPVVIFLTGGAWCIGNKAWGSLLGLGLSAHGVLVASVDYRNFPQGDVADMCRDVHTAIAWVFRHAEEYGGDPKRIFLVGQSAGAHLGSLAVLQNVEALLRGSRTSWTSKNLAGFVGISGCYDLVNGIDHFHERGLPSWVFLKLMRSTLKDELARYSTLQLVTSDIFSLNPRSFQKLMPTFLLIHGKGDKTVSWRASHEFAQVLMEAKVKVAVRYYKNYSHTDPIIEGPLTGHDHLCHDLLAFFNQQQQQHQQIQLQQQQHQQQPHPHRPLQSSHATTYNTPLVLSRTVGPAASGTIASSDQPTHSLRITSPTQPPMAHGLPPPSGETLVSRRTPPNTSQSSTSSTSSSSLNNTTTAAALPHPSLPWYTRPLTILSRLSDRLVDLLSHVRNLFFGWCQFGSTPNLSRRPSHLPHPFNFVDDVEEEENGVDPYGDSDEQYGGEVYPPPPLATMHSWPIRILQALSNICLPFVPSSFQKATNLVTRPVLRFLLPSPPPPESRESPPPPADATTTKARVRWEDTPPDTLYAHRKVNSLSRYSYPLQPPADLPHFPPKPLVSRMLIRIARWINPF